MSNFVFKTSNISPHFFPQFFQEWIFWHFCIFWPTKWIFMALVLIFSKFGMYLPYKNRFWADFSWFLARCTYSTVWTRSGPKIDFQLLVSKGLRLTFPVSIQEIQLCSKVVGFIGKLPMYRLRRDFFARSNCKSTWQQSTWWTPIRVF